MQSYNSNISVPNFMRNGKGRSSHPRKNSVEQFVTDSYNAENKRINGNFISRNFGSLTAQYGSYSIITIGELVLLATVYAKKKSKFPTPELKNAFRNKMLLMLGGFCVLGISFGVAVQNWQNRMINKKSTKPQELLDKYGNDTSAKLAANNLRSTFVAAQYNSINGEIEINKNYLHDPIGKKLIEKYMKHELQHARQFEMIAGLDNGLEKLNFACIYPIAQFVKTNPEVLAFLKDIIKNMNNDISGKYKNIKIPLSGVYVDLQKYIKALEILINNPHAKPKDIPMLIDVEHYKKALAKRGPLSEKEKIKAQEYYQAAIKYPIMTHINLITFYTGYRNNILEIEARKASRSKTGKIYS